MNCQYRRFWSQIFGLFPDLKQWQNFFNDIEQQAISTSFKMEAGNGSETWNNLKVDVDPLLKKNYAPNEELLSLEFPLKTMKQLLDIIIYCFELFIDLLKFRLFHHQVSASDIVNLEEFFDEHPEQQSDVKSLLEKSYPNIFESIMVYMKFFEKDCVIHEKDDHQLLIVAQTIRDKLKTKDSIKIGDGFGFFAQIFAKFNQFHFSQIEKRNADSSGDVGSDSTGTGGNLPQSTDVRSLRKCSNRKCIAKSDRRELRSSNSKVKSSSIEGKSPKFEAKKTPKKNLVQRKALKNDQFQCANCRKSFGTIEKLCNHIKKTYLNNNTGLSYKCLICSKSLSDKNNFIQHMLRIHNILPDMAKSGMVYVCKCGFSAKNDDGHRLYQHFVKKHRSNGKCMNCAKNYQNKQGLLRHVVQTNCCLNMVKSKFIKCPFKCCAGKDDDDQLNPYQMKLHIFRSHIVDF